MKEGEREAIFLRFNTYEDLSEFKSCLYKLARNHETIRLIEAFDLADVSSDTFNMETATTYGWMSTDVLFGSTSYHTIQPEGYVLVLPYVRRLSDNVDRKGKIV